MYKPRMHVVGCQYNADCSGWATDASLFVQNPSNFREFNTGASLAREFFRLRPLGLILGDKFLSNPK